MTRFGAGKIKLAIKLISGSESGSASAISPEWPEFTCLDSQMSTGIYKPIYLYRIYTIIQP